MTNIKILMGISLICCVEYSILCMEQDKAITAHELKSILADTLHNTKFNVILFNSPTDVEKAAQIVKKTIIKGIDEYEAHHGNAEAAARVAGRKAKEKRKKAALIAYRKEQAERSNAQFKKLLLICGGIGTVIGVISLVNYFNKKPRYTYEENT